MSKRETWMTVAYWDRIGGLLLEEYELVPRGTDRGVRRADAVIILGGERIRQTTGHRGVSLRDHDIVIVQTKASRLGMSVLGQALFSRELAVAHGPKSVRTVVLCSQDDAVLRPIGERYKIEIEVMTDDVRRVRDEG